MTHAKENYLLSILYQNGGFGLNEYRARSIG